ncbi:MAG: hypothetical protein HRT87_01625 [Legionellales bacterium]|nr:hypothetical protein [Legionellales bacterium]
MRNTNQNIEQAKSELAEILQFFRGHNFSMRQCVDLVCGCLVDAEIRRHYGNQTKAATSLNVSRGTFRKMLARVEQEQELSIKNNDDIGAI